MNLLALLAVAAGSTLVVYAGSTRLERAGDRLAAYYGLPGVVQGAVVAAVGSSTPELASTVLATALHGEFELGVAAIVGSAVFNVLVIPALSTLLSDGTMDTDRDLVYKEAQFYMLSVAALTLVFALAVIYNPVPGAELSGLVTRPYALAPIVLYGLYVFIQYADTIEYEGVGDREVDAPRQWLLLVGSLALIVVGVEGLVQAALGLGDAFGTPAFLWGVTVVAAGTSLPDAFVSVVAARAGRDSVSLANVLGSNVFDLLVAVPAGVLVAGATTVNFARVTPLIAFLVVATVGLFAAMRTDLELTRAEATAMLGLYLLFVAWMFTEVFGVTTLLQ